MYRGHPQNIKRGAHNSDPKELRTESFSVKKEDDPFLQRIRG